MPIPLEVRGGRVFIDLHSRCTSRLAEARPLVPREALKNESGIELVRESSSGPETAVVPVTDGVPAINGDSLALVIYDTLEQAISASVLATEVRMTVVGIICVPVLQSCEFF